MDYYGIRTLSHSPNNQTNNKEIIISIQVYNAQYNTTMMLQLIFMLELGFSPNQGNLSNYLSTAIYQEDSNPIPQYAIFSTIIVKIPMQQYHHVLANIYAIARISPYSGLIFPFFCLRSITVKISNTFPHFLHTTKITKLESYSPKFFPYYARSIKIIFIVTCLVNIQHLEFISMQLGSSFTFTYPYLLMMI